jgi:hypothetical protein
MTMTFNSHSPSTLNDALYSLAVLKPALDAAALDEIVREYPEHAAALTEMAILLVLDSLEIDDDEVAPLVDNDTVSAAVSKAISRFHNELYQIQKTESVVAPEKRVELNPFEILNREQIRSLAANLHVNTLFVTKLRDRLIEERTITRGFKDRLAHELRQPFELVAAYLQGSTQLQTNVHYKSEVKPSAPPKQTFEEAIKLSGLTPEQQTYLLSLK